MKGNVDGVVARRVCRDGSEMIRGTMKKVVGVGGNDDVGEFYPNHICCRKWRS